MPSYNSHNKLLGFFIVILLLANAAKVNSQVQSPFVVNYRVKAVNNEGKFNYYMELIDTALKRTEQEYGPYKLSPLPELTFTRMKRTAKDNSISNLILGTSYSAEMEADYAYIPIPMDFGITSYRVCFTRKEKIEELKRIKSINELRRYSIGQGKDWLDVAVLRANGFTVIEYPNYKNLFQAVARGRFDLFCRSIDEIRPEWEIYKDIKGLSIEESFIIHYEFPRFFWTNRENKLLIERLSKGLSSIFEDSTALTIWKKHHLKNIEFVKLKGRNIFYLENPQLNDLQNDFNPYYYDPFTIESHKPNDS
jgi:hypothetical protein